MALACDLRVARSGGIQVGLPEVALGVLPGTGGTQRLARLVGKSRAIELMCEGEKLSVERAKDLGIVNKVWQVESLEAFMQRALDYARSFTAPSKAALAVGRIKRAVQTGAEASLDVGLALERELLQQLFRSQDAKEGLAAFAEKRAPSFKAR